MRIAIGLLAAALADEVKTGTLLFVASDEMRAAALAEVLGAFAPQVTVVHLPASDALPGDDAPASPGNAGARVAALRRLRIADGDGQVVACITTPEATALRIAAPADFDAAPPVLRVGDAIDLIALAERAEGLGYIRDDRVDEPGEVAVRGSVVDIFPADAECPIRVTVEDDHIASIRSYDPVTQRGDADLPEVTIGRAAEPAVGKGRRCSITCPTRQSRWTATSPDAATASSIWRKTPPAAAVATPLRWSMRQAGTHPGPSDGGSPCPTLPPNRRASSPAVRRRAPSANSRGRCWSRRDWCWPAVRATCGSCARSWRSSHGPNPSRSVRGMRRSAPNPAPRCCWSPRSTGGSCATV
ncbi:hypothetical protein ACVOMT_09815 [Sphingomonas panni]